MKKLSVLEKYLVTPDKTQLDTILGVDHAALVGPCHQDIRSPFGEIGVGYSAWVEA